MSSVAASLVGYASTAQRNSIESPLLRLPGEIRNHIWQYVFDPHTYSFRSKARIEHGHPVGTYIIAEPTSMKWLGIRTVSRLIHTETASFPYAQATMCFRSLDTFKTVTTRRTPAQRRGIETVKFDLPGSPDVNHIVCGSKEVGTYVLLKALPGIKHVEVNFEMPNGHHWMLKLDVELVDKLVLWIEDGGGVSLEADES